MCAAGAFVGLSLASTLGDIHGHLDQRLITFLGAAAFFVLGIVAVHSLAGTLSSAARARSGRAAGTALRVVISFVGYVIVVFVGLGLLSVPVQHLLVGGALTGVILGIAAQQVLGNLFAGFVLLLARPFTLGERVRVRAGSLGGIFEGVVRNMNLTYVSIETDDGMVNVANSVMLAVGVGPAPPARQDPDLQVVRAGAPPSEHEEPSAASPWGRRYLASRYRDR